MPSSAFITPSTIFSSRKAANFSPNCRQPYISRVKSSRPSISGSVCLSKGMKPVLISATPMIKVSKSTSSAALMELGNLSGSTCLSRRYTADKRMRITKAGAFQCGRVGRVSENSQNIKIRGMAVQSKRRETVFWMLVFPLKAATMATMAKMKFTGLL